VVNDDGRWWKLLRDYYQRFKYHNIMTEDVVQFFNAQLGQNLTPIFDQYLRRADIPTLELAFNEPEATMAYRWKADERDFAMPVRVGSRGSWQVLEPTTDWQVMKSPLRRDDVEVATDLYYIHVTKQ
jgi:aminopeptidase N